MKPFLSLYKITATTAVYWVFNSNEERFFLMIRVRKLAETKKRLSSDALIVNESPIYIDVAAIFLD